MKANRFQIGDFVLIKGEPARVESLTKRKVGYHLKEGEDQMHYVRIFEVKPIEITTDIIEKVLNFEIITYTNSYNKGIWMYSINDKYDIEMDYDTSDVNMPFNIRIKDDRWREHGNCDVRYLHQVQQIIRIITDEELDIHYER